MQQTIVLLINIIFLFALIYFFYIVELKSTKIGLIGTIGISILWFIFIPLSGKYLDTIPNTYYIGEIIEVKENNMIAGYKVEFKREGKYQYYLVPPSQISNFMEGGTVSMSNNDLEEFKKVED